jgi:hypothetical protein
MTLTLPKWGLGSPSGLSEIQNSIAGVKTPRLEVFFISLERYWSVDVENGLTWAIWTFITQVMAKERPGIKLAIWLLTIKSRESTQFPCIQATCNIPLESSWRGIQLFFRPHHNQRSTQEVMRLQSCRSPNCYNFRTPTWESQDKKSFGCGPRGEAQNILYGGRWWLLPSLGRGVLWVQSRPWLVLAPKVFQKMN